MPFREKLAWLALTTMIAAYAIYFYLIGNADAAGDHNLIDVIWTFGAVAACQAVFVIVCSILLAVTSAKDARSPADERDRAISRRGASIGYYVLLVGVILVGVVMPFSETPWRIVNAALAAVVLAEIVRYSVVLVSYRRGWNG